MTVKINIEVNLSSITYKFMHVKHNHKNLYHQNKTLKKYLREQLNLCK